MHHITCFIFLICGTNGSVKWIRTTYSCSDRCVLCGEQEETYVHLFCKCPVVRPLWGIITHLLRRMGMRGVYTTPATIVLGNLVRLHEMSLVPWVTELPTPDHRAVTRWAQRIWAILRLTTLNIWTLRNQARLDPQGYTPQHRVRVQLQFWGQLR